MSDFCVLCQHQDAALICRKNGFTVVRCTTCTLVRVSPPPSKEELDAYYREGYNQFRYSFATPSVEPARRKSKELKIIERFVRPGKLLDVGSAHGHFLTQARYNNWEVTGVEPQDEARERSKARFNLNVHPSLAEAADNHFDVVTMWHVIEHIASPFDFLNDVQAKLSGRGLLAIATPNVDSLVARATGESWSWLSPPDHLFLYSPVTLQRLLRQSGFEVLHVETRRGESRNFILLMLQAASYRLGVFARMKESVQKAAYQVHTTPSLRSKVNFFYIVEKITDLLSYLLYPLLIMMWKRGWGDEVLVISRKQTWKA